MNKKYFLMFGLVGLFAVALVTAAVLDYYGAHQQQINVTQPITTEGALSTAIDCESGETCSDGSITIFNSADDERSVNIASSDEDGINEDGIKTTYVGELVLTKKDPTTWIPTDDKTTITYTVVGDSFKVSGVPDGYTLIYYKDSEANADDANRLVTLGEIGSVTENLPHDNDWNVKASTDYCNNGYDNYSSCRGAKLWAVKNENIVDGELVWSNPEDFYFETNLIQYNSEGNIIIYGESDLTITPEYALDILLDSGVYTINTTVNPTA